MYKKPTITIDGKLKVVARHVMEQHLGRALLTEEIVHHIDENPFNNEISNLQIVSRAEHKRIHDEIGKSTRFKHLHSLDSVEILELFKTKTCTEIAQAKGCSYKTITRLIRGAIGKTFDLRKRRIGTRTNYRKDDLYE